MKGEITVEEIAKKFEISPDEFDKIIDDFYEEKLTEVNDKTLICIAIDILRIINSIALRYANVTEILDKYLPVIQPIEMILMACCTLIEIIMSTTINQNDITKPVKLIQNWLKVSMNVLKEEMNVSNIEALETLTTPLYALDDMLAKLEKEDGNKEDNTTLQ